MLHKTPKMSFPTAAASVTEFPGIHRFGSAKWFWYYLWKRRFSPSHCHRQPHQTPHDDMNRRIASYIDNVDPVPPEIVAAVKSKRLYDAAPACFKPLVALTLAQNFVESIPEIPCRSATEESEILAKKGVPHDTVHDPAATLLENLAQDVPQGLSLFTHDAELEHQISRKSTDYTANNCFVVDKSTINPSTNEAHKRVIVDARRANAKLQNIAPMELFPLELLIERIAYAQQIADQEIHCVSADLRHWFHQLPLPRHFRRHFALRIVTRRGSTKLVFPRAWPMGVHCAPGIGQACTWSILLARLEQPADETEQQRSERLALRNRLGIAPTQEWKEIPSWLPLASGGAVFVLIDNIFVVSPDLSVAEAWRSRIVRSPNDFHAQLKRSPDEAGRTCYARQNHAQDVQLVSLPKGDTQSSIDFSGISFSGAGRRVAKPPPPENPVPVDSDWKVSFRRLASVMGQLLWCERVRGTPMLDMDRFLEIYKYAIPPDNESWNKDTTVPARASQHLSSIYDKCSSKSNQYIPYPEVVDIASAEVYFGASDAEGGEKKGIVFVFKKLEQDAAKFDWTVVDRNEAESHGFEKIALGELRAVVELVRTLVRTYENDNPKLIMLAVDNMSVIGMISRAYSKVPEGRDMLRELFSLLEKNNSKLFVTYIESKKNPSDAPSRGGVVIQQQLLDLELRFSKLEPVARKALLVAGKNRLARRGREETPTEENEKIPRD